MLPIIASMLPYLYSYADTKTEPIDFHDYMLKFDRFPDDPSNSDIDLLNEKRARLYSLLRSQPNTSAVLEVIGQRGVKRNANRTASFL